MLSGGFPELPQGFEAGDAPSFDGGRCNPDKTNQFLRGPAATSARISLKVASSHVSMHVTGLCQNLLSPVPKVIRPWGPSLHGGSRCVAIACACNNSVGVLVCAVCEGSGFAGRGRATPLLGWE